MTDNLFIRTNVQYKPKRISMRKGRWSAEELVRFNEALALFGRNWKKIQSYVKSRSLLQIRSHAQKYFIMKEKIQRRNRKIRKHNQFSSQNISSEFNKQIFQNQNFQQINKQFSGPTLPDIYQNSLPTANYTCSIATILPQSTFTNNSTYPTVPYQINIVNNCVAPTSCYPPTLMNMPVVCHQMIPNFAPQFFFN